MGGSSTPVLGASVALGLLTALSSDEKFAELSAHMSERWGHAAEAVKEGWHYLNEKAAQVNGVAPALGGLIGGGATVTAMGGSLLTVAVTCGNSVPAALLCAGGAAAGGVSANGALQALDGRFDPMELLATGANSATGLFIAANSIALPTYGALLKDAVWAIASGRSNAVLAANLKGEAAPVVAALTEKLGVVKDLGLMAIDRVTGGQVVKSAAPAALRKNFLETFANFLRSERLLPAHTTDWIREAEDVLHDLRVDIKNLPDDMLNWAGWSTDTAKEFYLSLKAGDNPAGSMLLRWLERPEITDVLMDARRLRLTYEGSWDGIKAPDIPASAVSANFKEVEKRSLEELAELIPQLQKWLKEVSEFCSKGPEVHASQSALSLGEIVKRDFTNYLYAVKERWDALTVSAFKE